MSRALARMRFPQSSTDASAIPATAATTPKRR